MWIPENANPAGNDDVDCTVRAISKVTDKTWDEVYAALCAYGFGMKRMPVSDSVWGSYLRDLGWRGNFVLTDCDYCQTVRDFCRQFPIGRYLVKTDEHVVAVIDGNIYDTFNSSGMVPIYYFYKET